MMMPKKRFHAVSILVFFGLLFAAGALVYANLTGGGDRLVASGTLPGANVTITTTAGAADIDLASATIPRNYKGHRLDVADPYGKHAQGYVYTNGAGTIQNVKSTKGGTTQNWAAIESGFNATATGDFVYRIYRDDRVPVVASGTVTQANTRLDLTAINAFAWLNGVDLSAYQTGDYYLCLYNATGGYAACGYISAVAPAGESLEADAIAGWDFTSGWGKTSSATIIDANSFSTTANGGVGKSFGVSLALYKINASAAGSGSIQLLNYAGEYYFGAGTPLSVVNAYFSMRTSPGCSINAVGAQNPVDVATLSFERVLDPPSTAVRIVSTHDGAGRSWTHKHASFNPNDTAGVTLKIYYVGD
jgi:hypothetical protein